MRPAPQAGYNRQWGRQGIEMDTTVIHTNIGMWENLHKAIGLFKFESHVSEDLTLGTTLSTSGVTKTAFALFDFGRGVTEATINFEDTEKIKATLMGSVEIDPDTLMKAHVHSDGTSLFEVHHTKQGWTFNPSLNLKTRKAGMMASAEIDVRARGDTTMRVHLRDDGSSEFEANHDLDPSTSVKVKSTGVDLMKTYVEVNHLVDKRNLVRPSYDVKSRSFKLAWTHKLDDVYYRRYPVERERHYRNPNRQSHHPGDSVPMGRALIPKADRLQPYRHGRRITGTLVPDHFVSVEFESDNREDFQVSLSVPWSGGFKSSKVTLSRKFDL